MSTLANPNLAFLYQTAPESVQIQLKDGPSLTIRPVNAKDVQPILEMHDRLSSDTVYYRYLHPYRPTFAEIDFLHRMNSRQGAAFIAALESSQEKVVALALYQMDAENPTVAQPAILIEDRFQHQGLGGALMRVLCEHARMNQIQTFDALVHPMNQRVIHLLKQNGLAFQAKLGYGALQVQIDLNQSV